MDGKQNQSNNCGIPLLTLITMSIIISLLPLITANDPTGILTFLGVIVSGALFSFVYFVTNKPYIFIVAPISYASALIITKNPIIAISALAFLSVGVILRFSIMKKISRVNTVIYMSVSFIIFTVLYLILTIAVTYNGFSQEIIEGFYNTQTQPLRDLYSTLTVDVNGSQVKLFTSSEVDTVITTLVTLMPAVFVCFSNVISYLVTSIFIKLSKLFKIEQDILPRQWYLDISVISAYVFCGAYVLSVFGSGLSNNVLYIASMNILIMLNPGFTLIGIKNIVKRVKSRSRNGMGLTIVYIVVAFMLLFINIAAFFTLTAFFGVIDVIIGHYKIRKNGERL